MLEKTIFMTKTKNIEDASELITNNEELSDFMHAANQGAASAQYILGVIYDTGVIVDQNYQEAVFWYLQAAKQRYKEAEFALGTMYSEGSGVMQSDVLALMWYYAANKNGYTKSRDQINIVAKRMVPEDIQRAEVMSVQPLNFTDS